MLWLMRFLEIDSYMTALTTLMTVEQSPRHMGKGRLSQGEGGSLGKGSPSDIIADKWQYFMGFYLGTKVSRALSGERATKQLPTELSPKQNMCAQHVPLSLCLPRLTPAPLG